MGGKAYIGTSGWQYDDWRGRFYPEGIPKRSWLDHLSHTLDSVEVNGTFYSLPKRDTIKGWTEETPREFRFALKMWRGVTHYKKLKDPEPKLKRFFSLTDPIPSRQRAPVLMQLPGNQGQDLEKLDHYLDAMKKETRDQHWRRTMEFRHDSWIDDETYALLDKHNTAICLHDMRGGGATDAPNDVRFVYVRKHGPTGQAKGRYTKNRLQKEAKQVEDWLDGGKDVFIYFNNDEKAYAAKNACEMKEALGTGC